MMKRISSFLLAGCVAAIAACAAHTVTGSSLSTQHDDQLSHTGVHRIVLPGGDVVHYETLESGRATLTVDTAPRPEQYPVVFSSEKTGADFWFYPSDLRGYVNTGALDRDFFNIPARAGLQTLPITLVYDHTLPAQTIERHAAVLPGAREVRMARGTGHVRLTIDDDAVSDFWQAVLDDRPNHSFQNGIEQILFGHHDARFRAAVAESDATATVGHCEALEMVELTVQGIRRDGQPAAGASSLSSFQIVNVDDATIHASTEYFVDGLRRLCLPAGRYSVLGLVNTYDPDLEALGFYIPLEWVMVGNPELEIASATTLLLDARDANEITFSTPQPTTRVDNFYRLQWHRAAAAGGGRSGGISGVVFLDNHPAQALRRFAVETQRITTGEFEVVVDARLVAPDFGPASPLLYDLVVPYNDVVPADLHYNVDIDALAMVVNRLYSDRLPAGTMVETRNVWRPWQSISVNSGRPVQVALQRTEYLVPGDSRYQQRIDSAGLQATSGPGRMDETETTYAFGEQRQRSWFKPPMRPGVREMDPGASPVIREGDQLILLMPEWVDSEPGHFGFRHTSVDSTAFRLFRNGVQIAATARPRGTFPMAAEVAEYRMEVDIQRDADWQNTSTRSHTAWTFQSGPVTSDEPVVLPVVLLDYELELGLNNHTTEQSGMLTVIARHQAGVDLPAIGDLDLWVSRDDGFSWQHRSGESAGDGRFHFPMEDVHGVGGAVALRVRAHDEVGNGIEQEISNAYRVPEGIPPEPPPVFSLRR